jgi:hypothetical protein
MFIGHFAVGFASKPVAPRTSLALLLAAPLLADILWPFFLLFGWEHVRIDRTATRFSPLDLYHFPWSHSLLALLVWATMSNAGLCRMGVVSIVITAFGLIFVRHNQTEVFRCKCGQASNEWSRQAGIKVDPDQLLINWLFPSARSFARNPSGGRWPR